MSVNDIFKNPILNCKVSNTETALEVYKEMRKKNESRNVSNRGGYQSPLLLKEEREKIFTTDIMKDILEEAMFVYDWKKPLNFNIDGAWFNANENGDYNISHRHSKCHFSFVWYLKVPDSSSGQLILEHPDSALDGVKVREIISGKITPSDKEDNPKELTKEILEILNLTMEKAFTEKQLKGFKKHTFEVKVEEEKLLQIINLAKNLEIRVVEQEVKNKLSEIGLFDLERNSKNHYNSEFMQITPSESLMVMFPASLKHRVERYEGQATRISLAFNGSFKQ